MVQTMKTQSVNGIALAPVKAPIAIGLEYQRALVKLVKRLNKEVYNALSSEYADFESVITQDASPVFQIEMRMKKIFERYTALFNKTGQSLAERFVSSINRSNFNHFKREFTKQSLTIRPDDNYIGALNVNKALIADNVNLITNLSEKQYEQIHGDLMRSIANGGDLQQIEKDLRKRGIQTEKRARLIARDQLFKANSAINNQRMKTNGITKAIWRHSRGDKVPRRSHLAADGKVYETAKGCLIDGEYIYPADKVNCTCFCQPFIEL